METRLLFVHALSPVHAGTGQSVGAVDLPIARDRSTGYPYLPGSGIKGALRSRSLDLGRTDTVAVFGPETASASDHAGALIVGDANLLLLPVRSVAGTFAYLTSPWLLLRFVRDAKEAGLASVPAPVQVPLLSVCAVPTSSVLKAGPANAPKVYFEDLDLNPAAALDVEANTWASFLAELLFPADPQQQAQFKSRFCVVNDDVMSFFSRHGTDVVTRVCIDRDTGTAKDGQLWTEESLPVETVLVALALARPVAKLKTAPADTVAALGSLCEGSLQLGGKATVGRGRCRVVIAGDNS